MYLWIGSFWHGDFEWFQLNFYYAFILSCVCILVRLTIICFCFCNTTLSFHLSHCTYVCILICLSLVWFEKVITRIARTNDKVTFSTHCMKFVCFSFLFLFFFFFFFAILLPFGWFVSFFLLFFLVLFSFSFLNRKQKNQQQLHAQQRQVSEKSALLILDIFKINFRSKWCERDG